VRGGVCRVEDKVEGCEAVAYVFMEGILGFGAPEESVGSGVTPRDVGGFV
jgi:hypothetical protein